MNEYVGGRHSRWLLAATGKWRQEVRTAAHVEDPFAAAIHENEHREAVARPALSRAHHRPGSPLGFGTFGPFQCDRSRLRWPQVGSEETSSRSPGGCPGGTYGAAAVVRGARPQVPVPPSLNAVANRPPGLRRSRRSRDQRLMLVCLNSLSSRCSLKSARTPSIVDRAPAASSSGRVMMRTKAATSPTTNVGTPKT